MANSDDDEWEYEYEATETEDLFIPLDLTNVPGAQIPMASQGRPGHPTLLKTRLRALNAARGQPVEFSTDMQGGQETATMGEIQIIGLHTPNPLVSYNGQLLSCHWTSTIGTDMFFVKPETTQADGTQPLRSLPSVDLLSLGSAKLVAKVGRLRPRDDLVNNVRITHDNAVPSAVNRDNQIGGTSCLQSTPELQQSMSKQAQPGPSSFISKLNEMKAKRGEISRLAIARTSEGPRLVSKNTDISGAT